MTHFCENAWVKDRRELYCDQPAVSKAQRSLTVRNARTYVVLWQMVKLIIHSTPQWR